VVPISHEASGCSGKRLEVGVEFFGSRSLVPACHGRTPRDVELVERGWRLGGRALDGGGVEELEVLLGG
jgi:hypothetical protein